MEFKKSNGAVSLKTLIFYNSIRDVWLNVNTVLLIISVAMILSSCGGTNVGSTKHYLGGGAEKVMAIFTPEGCSYELRSYGSYSCNDFTLEEYLNEQELSYQDIRKITSGSYLSNKDIFFLISTYYDCGDWRINYQTQTFVCTYKLSPSLIKLLQDRISFNGEKEDYHFYLLKK